MAKFTLESLGRTKAGFSMIPEGKYEAELEKIEPADNANGPRLLYRFRIEDGGPYSGKKVIGRVSASVNVESKNMKWFSVLQGGPLGLDVKPDWEGVIGKRAIIEVVHNFDGATTWVNIAAIYPIGTPDSIEAACAKN